MSDALDTMRRQMGIRRTVGRFVDGARRAMGIRPDVTSRMELVITTIASRIGQPPVLVSVVEGEDTWSDPLGDPLYCSVCRTHRSLSPKARVRGLAPRLTQAFRCGFLLVLCEPCWRRIRNTGRVIDRVIETHRQWHFLMGMAVNILEYFEHGAGSLGMGGKVN
jgi:hypothetical protein